MQAKASIMDENKYTWIPIYQELANALLQYKDNRKPLVDWIYDDLSSILSNNGKSLINYLHEKDGSRISDIDPFSVYAIFNRGITNANRAEILKKFKDTFKLHSDIPSDYDGIPVVNNMRSFFFSWEDDNKERIENLWSLFYKVLKGEDFSTEYNIAAKASGIKYNITMWLFWLRPYDYLAFDERNRNGLKTMGIDIKESDAKDCSRYLKLINDIKVMMKNGILPFKSFPELSFTVWNHDVNGLSILRSRKVWCWNCMGDPYNSFKLDYIGMGDSVKEIKDYSTFKTKDELGQEYRKIHGNADVSVPDAYWKFMKEVSIDDIVVVTTNKMQNGTNTHLLYGWGIFTSNFYSVPDDDDHLRRDVKWHRPYLDNPILDDELRNTLFFHSTTATQASKIIKLLHIDLNKKEMNKIQPYIDLLIANYNIILTGAPGTGKTYLARHIAAAMIGCKPDELDKSGHFGFVQFHPSYDYTDFVEGLRPVQNDDSDGQIGFERKDGVFKEFCENALKEDKEERPYIFVIDEINRGEISKIFGELFFSIDPGYRGKEGAVRTQYANLQTTPNAFDAVLNSDTYGHFFVPDNVYIIGTMNDIDRSVESMDFAMRRRFAWEEVTAEESMAMLNSNNNQLENVDADTINELKNRMKNLNDAIIGKYHKDSNVAKSMRLGTAYQIGGSYFLKLGKYYKNGKENAFEKLWDNHIKNVVSEYLRGNTNFNEQLSYLESAYNDGTAHENEDVDNTQNA